MNAFTVLEVSRLYGRPSATINHYPFCFSLHLLPSCSFIFFALVWLFSSADFCCIIFLSTSSLNFRLDIEIIACFFALRPFPRVYTFEQCVNFFGKRQLLYAQQLKPSMWTFLFVSLYLVWFWTRFATCFCVQERFASYRITVTEEPIAIWASISAFISLKIISANVILLPAVISAVLMTTSPFLWFRIICCDFWQYWKWLRSTFLILSLTVFTWEILAIF